MHFAHACYQETLLTTVTSDGTTITTGIATATGNASNGVVSTFTTAVTDSDGNVHTSTGQTTLSGTISVTLTGSVPTATGTDSAALTTVTSGSSAIVKTLTTKSETATVTESATQTESTNSGAEATETETATETASSSASSTSSTGAGVSLDPLTFHSDSLLTLDHRFLRRPLVLSVSLPPPALPSSCSKHLSQMAPFDVSRCTSLIYNTLLLSHNPRLSKHLSRPAWESAPESIFQ